MNRFAHSELRQVDSNCSASGEDMSHATNRLTHEETPPVEMNQSVEAL